MLFRSYGRFLGDNRCVAAVNNDDKDREIRIPVWEIGIGDNDHIVRVMLTNEIGFSIGPVIYKAENGILTVNMGPYSGILLVSNKRS